MSSRAPSDRTTPSSVNAARRSAAGAVSWLLVGMLGGDASAFTMGSGDAGRRESDADRSRVEGLRKDALARARVWRDPARAIAHADLGRNPSDAGVLASADPVTCRFQPNKIGGATPKFECLFENGEVLKVKYDSREVYTETAATRLLAALGFGADRMYILPALRCYGCPLDPYAMLTCISNRVPEALRACEPFYGRVTPDGAFEVAVDYARYVDFGPVAVERRLEGRAIRDGAEGGWGFDELDRAQAAGGGDSRAHRDALRMLAVFLDNWDTRPDNQALVCLDADRHASEVHCESPFAYMQDVGATFGRVGGESKWKLDVEGWGKVPVWKDAERCTVAIKSPVFHGTSFGEVTISESGRRFLGDRLAQISPGQVRALFEGALFASYPEASPADKDVGNWMSAFQDKVRQIVKRAPCPTP